MSEPPRTARELWAAVPRETWLGSRMDLTTFVGSARDELEAARARARSEIAAAEAELTRVIIESWLSGASWRAIGVLLGVSRQAAAQRYGAAVRLAVEAIQETEHETENEKEKEEEQEDG